MHSPLSEKGCKRSGNDLYPLLMPERWRGALRHLPLKAVGKKQRLQHPWRGVKEQTRMGHAS